MIEWSYFNNILDNHPKRRSSNIHEFFSIFIPGEYTESKKHIPAFSLVSYAEKTMRGSNGILSVNGLVLDFDGKNVRDGECVSIDTITNIFKDISHIAYETKSNTCERPCFRIVIPFSKNVSQDEYKSTIYWSFANIVNDSVGRNLVDNNNLDKTGAVPAMLYVLPTKDKESQCRIIKNTGHVIDPNEYLLRKNVELALKKIDPDEGYEQWIKIGMALKSKFSDEGLEIWDTWSSFGSKYNGGKDIAAHWKSFNGDGVGLGTIFHISQKRALVKLDHSKTYKKTESIFQEDDLINSGWEGFDNYDVFNLSHCERLKMIFDFYKNHSSPFLPDLALGAAINIAGFTMADAVECLGRRTNFYTLLIAPTGSGKQAITSNINKIMRELGYSNLLINKFGTIQAFHKKLLENNGKIFTNTDEAASFFKSFSSAASEGYEQIKASLKEVFSGDIYRSIEYKGTPSITLERTFVTMSLLGTPEIFTNISEADFRDGFLGRMLVFASIDEDVHECGAGIEALIGNNNADYSWVKELHRYVPSCSRPHQLYTARNELIHFYEKFQKIISSKKRKMSGYEQNLIARMPENYNKLLMLTVDEKGKTTIESAMWAASVAIRSYKTICNLVVNEYEKSQFTINTEKIVKAIHRRKEIEESKLRLLFKVIRPRMFDECIEHLIKSNQIIISDTPGGVYFKSVQQI